MERHPSEIRDEVIDRMYQRSPTAGSWPDEMDSRGQQYHEWREDLATRGQDPRAWQEDMATRGHPSMRWHDDISSRGRHYDEMAARGRDFGWQEKPTRGRRCFSIDFKLAVVDYVKAGNSNDRTAKHFNIDAKQVREWLKNEKRMREIARIGDGEFIRKTRIPYRRLPYPAEMFSTVCSTIMSEASGESDAAFMPPPRDYPHHPSSHVPTYTQPHNETSGEHTCQMLKTAMFTALACNCWFSLLELCFW